MSVERSFIDRLLVAIAASFAVGTLAGYAFAHTSTGALLRPWRGLAREVAHAIVDAGGTVK